MGRACGQADRHSGQMLASLLAAGPGAFLLHPHDALLCGPVLHEHRLPQACVPRIVLVEGEASGGRGCRVIAMQSDASVFAECGTRACVQQLFLSMTGWKTDKCLSLT